MTVAGESAGRLDPQRFPTGWRGLRVLVVTGRLAEGLVRRVAAEAALQFGFQAEVHVLGISVAALMHVDWVRRKLSVDCTAQDVVLLPGWCQGDVGPLESQWGLPVVVGPKEILDLPEWLGSAGKPAVDLTRFDIEIIAEINHAPRLSERETIAVAERYRTDGADVIDIGCIPGESWNGVRDTVRRLRDLGLRVSIDSFGQHEVEAAVEAGAELVLSCNASNRNWLAQLPVESVAIPDDPTDLASLDETVARLESAGAKFRLDPILEPIGFGFTVSLERYYRTRRRHPMRPLMMGIGNVTELAQADTAGMHLLLATLCQELGIGSVLTTQVANWCRSAVREFALARRLVRHAVTQRTLLKRLPESLLMLRDPKLSTPGEDLLASLAERIADRNVRLLISGEELHLINREGHWRGTDPFEVFERFLAESSGVDAPHAFYLGYEIAKATMALTLGKQYTQDQPLNWGLLTKPESSRHERSGE